MVLFHKKIYNERPSLKYWKTIKTTTKNYKKMIFMLSKNIK